MQHHDKIVLCAPCCDKCPEVFGEGDMIVLTDDNDKTIGVRTIKLTKEQFKMLLEKGKSLI